MIRIPNTIFSNALDRQGTTVPLQRFLLKDFP